MSGSDADKRVPSKIFSVLELDVPDLVDGKLICEIVLTEWNFLILCHLYHCIEIFINSLNKCEYWYLGEKDTSDGRLADEGFVIIMQTTFQRSLMQKFGDKGLCCDATHGTTGRSFNQIRNNFSLHIWYSFSGEEGEICSYIHKPSRGTAGILVQ